MGRVSARPRGPQVARFSHRAWTREGDYRQFDSARGYRPVVLLRYLLPFGEATKDPGATSGGREGHEEVAGAG